MSKIIFRINIAVAALLILSYLAVFINPQHFWPIAFLGLAYPFLLILNILFIILWAIKLKPQILLSLLSVLIGWGHIGRYIQLDIPFIKEKPLVISQNSFKILSFNVRLFNRYNWLKDSAIRHEIFEFIEKEAPDIICFQDFFTRTKGVLSEKEIFKQLKWLKYNHIKYTLRDPQGASFGIATFSRYPIIERHEILFKNTFNLSIFTDIKINDDTIRIYNNHLQSIRFLKRNYDFVDSLRLRYNEINGLWDITTRLKWAFKLRAMQADSVASHIRQSIYPTIVCGDFNDTPVSYTYQIMRKNMKDAFVEAGSGFGNTYLGKFPSYRIDYIFFSNQLSAVNYHSPRLKLSDHYPVICRMHKN